jgi:VacB/RNase II family 3'-5' exoribonuclease
MNTDSESLNLSAIARQAMIDAGFVSDVPRPAVDELHAIEANPQTSFNDPSVRDLRSLLWSSIDDKKSRDLDQVEYAEVLPDGDVRVMVGIADVDAIVRKGSAIDAHAAENCTSVYTGIETFPMLPVKLSTDLTSLKGGTDRVSVVTEMIVGRDGIVKTSDIYRARLHNYAKLSYEAVGVWLDGGGAVPTEVASVPGMEAQIRLQFEVALRLRELRKQHGALEFGTIQVSPVVTDGQVTGLTTVERNGARDLIENFMIAANVAMAEFLETKGTMSLRRVVRTPEQWPRIVEIAHALDESLPAAPDARSLAEFLERRKVADMVHYPDLSLSIVKLLGPGEYIVQTRGEEAEGHFGLAVQDYTHSTAPNRRYADLVTQRLVKAVLEGAPTPYTEEELQVIAKRCTEREDAARKVERQMRKVAAAVLLKDRVDDEFDAIVTGVTPKGTFARLTAPPVDGRVIQGFEGLRVGDKVRVRLLSADPKRGFIDFGTISRNV